MAKKKGKGKFEFSKIGSIMENIGEKTGIMIEDSTDDTEVEYIDTGVYILNAMFSKSILKGGIMSNRITALAGPAGTGKSFICYNICRNAQAAGYSIVYIDTEFSIEMEDMNTYGIDTSPDKLKLVRSSKVEDIKKFMTQTLNELKNAKMEGYDIQKTLFVIDSAGQLASNKEVDDAIAGKDKADMSRAKAIKSLFRIINSDLGYLNIPLIVTNHTYMTMDFFPRPVMSGGCIEAGNKLRTQRGLINIEDIEKGEYVNTLNGEEMVYNTFTFDKERYEVEYDNGLTVICSEDHRFLNGNDWTENGDWVNVKDLKKGDDIHTHESIETPKDFTMVKIKDVKGIGVGKVHDIMVSNDHHYITEDGIVHHNTGLQYSASTIVMLSKAKLKTGNEDDLDIGQSGVIVTAKAEKNRRAVPKKVKFEINFSTGCNPFKGLESFCTPENFETVGIAKGKMDVDKKTGEMTFKPGGTRYYVNHLGKSVFLTQLHTSKIFTQEVLEALEPIIAKYFDYSNMEEIAENEKKFIEAQDEHDSDEYKDMDDMDDTDASMFE